MNLLKLWGQQA